MTWSLKHFSTFAVFLLLAVLAFPFVIQVISDEGAFDDRSEGEGSEEPAADTRFLTGSVDDWSMHLNGPRHTGFSASTAPNSNSTVWSWRECNCSIPNMTTPLIIGDRVYCPGSHSTIQCLDLTNGTPYWNFSTGQRMVYVTPTFYKGRLYLGNTNGTLFCVLAHNGSIAWTYPTTSQVAIRSSAIVVNDRAYFGSLNGYLYCLDAFTGQLIWKRHIGPVRAALAYDDGRLYAATSDNRMYCFNEADRTEVWNRTYEASSSPDEESAPLLVKDYVLIGTLTGGNLYCLWRSNGTERWKINVGPTISTPTYGYDTVFIPTMTGKIYRIGLNGTLVWQHDHGSEITSSISIADNKLFFTTFWGEITCLSVSDHTKVWNHSISDHRYGSRCTPAVAYNMVAVILGDGTLYGFGNYAKTDYTPPGVVFSGPYYGQTGVDINSTITVSFSEAMDPLTIIPSNFTLKNSTGFVVAGALSFDPATNSTSYTPSAPLQYTETYTFKVSGGVKDMSGLHLDGDGDGSFEGLPHDDFVLVFSTQVKNAPAFKPIPFQSYFEDKEYVIDLSKYITDADTPWANLTITFDSIYANLSATMLAFKYPNGVLGETINISVSDGTYSVFQHVQIEVVPVNDAPTIDPLPEVTITEDIPYTINVSEYINDIDNDWEDLAISCSGDSAKLRTAILGRTITITYVQQDGPYPDQGLVMNLSAYDSEFYAHQDLNIIAVSVNDAPILEKVPNINVLTGIPFKFDLEEHLSDIDTKPSNLGLVADSGHISVSGLVLTFEYPLGSEGQDMVNLTVVDGDIRIYQDITVTVKDGNRPPVLSAPQVDPELGTPADEFVFVVTYTDTDAYPDSVTSPVWSDYALVKVYVNDMGFEMDLVSGDLRTGAMFIYNNTYDPGNYTFYFTGNDLTPGNNSEARTDEMTFGVSEDTTPPPDDDDDSSNKALLIGIIVAIIVIVLILSIVAYLMIFRKTNEEIVSEGAPSPSGTEPQSAPSDGTAPQAPVGDLPPIAPIPPPATSTPDPGTGTQTEDLSKTKTSRKKGPKKGSKDKSSTGPPPEAPEQAAPDIGVQAPPSETAPPLPQTSSEMEAEVASPEEALSLEQRPDDPTQNKG